MNVSAPAPAAHSRPRLVLIVEDNALNRKLFQDLLEVQGCRTLQARDGLEALDLARRNLPDLILMDIQLPDVSGLDVIGWLNEHPQTCDIPVVTVTAFAEGGGQTS